MWIVLYAWASAHTFVVRAGLTTGIVAILISLFFAENLYARNHSKQMNFWTNE